MMPAFAAWMPSPNPGARTSSVVSASDAISTSAWPTPTVSTRARSRRAGSGNRNACGTAAEGAAGELQPPQRRRDGRREAAELAAGGHRPDEDVGVGRVILHPHAVTEQRA